MFSFRPITLVTPLLGPQLVPIQGLEEKRQPANVITICRIITAATVLEGQGRNRPTSNLKKEVLRWERKGESNGRGCGLRCPVRQDAGLSSCLIIPAPLIGTVGTI